MAEQKQYRPHDYEVKEALDGKQFGQLTPAMQLFVGSLFPKARHDDMVHCDLCDNYEKPDVVITVGDEAHFPSLKSGRSKSVHYENIKNLILFLRGLGVSEQTQKTLLFYHYGDGTLTGTGETRLEKEELLLRYPERISLAIAELNQKRIVRACLKRFLFTGSEKRVHSADYLAFGDINTFVVVSKDEIFDFVMRQSYNHLRSVHIGPMLLSPWQRNIKREEDKEWKRSIVHVTWPYLLTDMERMIKRRGH